MLLVLLGVACVSQDEAYIREFTAAHCTRYEECELMGSTAGAFPDYDTCVEVVADSFRAGIELFGTEGCPKRRTDDCVRAAESTECAQVLETPPGVCFAALEQCDCSAAPEYCE